MSQVTKISKNNTTVSNQGEDTIVTLHQTKIVVFNENYITLNHGGWPTATTRTRMSQVSHEMGLGYGVTMRGGQMEVSYCGNTRIVGRYSMALLDRKAGTIEII